MHRPRSSWRAWWTPAAGLAAAAVLVLAAASAIARIEVHRGPDGITVRTGWSASAPAADRRRAPARPLRGPCQRAATWCCPRPRDRVDADVARRARAPAATRSKRPSRDTGRAQRVDRLSARASDAEILRRVRELLAQSETKQQGELALRISQVIRDVDAQRVADLTRDPAGAAQDRRDRRPRRPRGTAS